MNAMGMTNTEERITFRETVHSTIRDGREVQIGELQRPPTYHSNNYGRSFGEESRPYTMRYPPVYSPRIIDHSSKYDVEVPPDDDNSCCAACPLDDANCWTFWKMAGKATGGCLCWTFCGPCMCCAAWNAIS